jgi:hypothetical protein
MSEDYDDGELHNLPEEKLKRIAVCASCENNVNDHCNQCACPISALTMFSFKSCPINKW